MSETIEIEISCINSKRETWFNSLVGERFEAKKSKHYNNHYELTEHGLMDLTKKIGKGFALAVIHSNFASTVEQEAVRNFNNLFMIFPTAVRHLREIRTFRVTGDYHTFDRSGNNIIATFFREGDIYEEVFDKPNTIVKVEGEKRDDGKGVEYKLQYINQSNFLLPLFEELEAIPVKESKTFAERKEGLANSYKRTRTVVYKGMLKLQELRFLLDIENEEE